MKKPLRWNARIQIMDIRSSGSACGNTLAGKAACRLWQQLVMRGNPHLPNARHSTVMWAKEAATYLQYPPYQAQKRDFNHKSGFPAILCTLLIFPKLFGCGALAVILAVTDTPELLD